MEYTLQENKLTATIVFHCEKLKKNFEQPNANIF